jgi:response regulator RpfG family c-di-GMP phosphodiesterase
LDCQFFYDEVCRFKQSVIRCESVDQTEAFSDCFTQYVADNVDHDVCTRDNSGTLHAMGIIAITDSCRESRSQLDAVEVPVPRLNVLKSQYLNILKPVKR